MKGSGGSEGGLGMFCVGFVLAAAGAYFFADSVRVVSGHGVFRGMMHSRGMGGMTTSMGVIFVPFFIGVILLFYNSDWKIGWGVSGLGLIIIFVEILSGIRFYMDVKVTHLLILLVMMAGGSGLMLRSFRDVSKMDRRPGES